MRYGCVQAKLILLGSVLLVLFSVLFCILSIDLKVVFLCWDLDVSRAELSRDFGGFEEALSCL